MISRYPGWCGMCHEQYPKGTDIVKYNGKWNHDACAPWVKEVQAHLDHGWREPRRRSTYRLGKSPGSFG